MAGVLNHARFSCSIPPLFVLSHSLPMVNTMGKLALFWRFSITVVSASSISLGTGHCSRATDTTRHTPLPPDSLATVLPPSASPAGSGGAQTLPRWLLPDTDHRIANYRTGPDLDEHPLYIQYVTEPGDSCAQIDGFFLIRHRSTVDHSLVERGAQRQWLQACPPDGHQPQCLFPSCLLAEERGRI